MMTLNAESLHLALTQEDGSKDLGVVPDTAPTAQIPRAAMREVLSYLAPGEISILGETELNYGRAAMSMYAAETPGVVNPMVKQFASSVGEASGALDSAIGGRYPQGRSDIGCIAHGSRSTSGTLGHHRGPDGHG